jgi:hypothetical protein
MARMLLKPPSCGVFFGNLHSKVTDRHLLELGAQVGAVSAGAVVSPSAAAARSDIRCLCVCAGRASAPGQQGQGLCIRVCGVRRRGERHNSAHTAPASTSAHACRQHLFVLLAPAGERHLLCGALPWPAAAVWAVCDRQLFKLGAYLAAAGPVSPTRSSRQPNMRACIVHCLYTA